MPAKRLLTFIFFLLLVSLMIACSSSKGEVVLNVEPVYITNQKIVFSPKELLLVTGHFNILCIKIPDGLKQDNSTWSMVSPEGVKIVPYATLTSTTGENHDFYQRSFLNLGGKYICLSPDAPIDPNVTFKQITIWSNLPFWTNELVWLNKDKL